MENCLHPKDKHVIEVITAIVGCETTRVKCTACDNYITEPIIDC